MNEAYNPILDRFLADQKTLGHAKSRETRKAKVTLSVMTRCQFTAEIEVPADVDDDVIRYGYADDLYEAEAEDAAFVDTPASSSRNGVSTAVLISTV